MLTIHDKNIIFGRIGGSGGGIAPVLPDGWDSGWMFPPTYNATSVNGKTDICGLVCNVLDIGDRNYFSCIATGAYTVNVYTDATATTLISTQNVATNTQANWSIDYAACTHQLDTTTRQAWVEVVPQSGQTLTTVKFNTNHPAETNANTTQNIVFAIISGASINSLSSIFYQCTAIRGFIGLNLSGVVTATSAFYFCLSLQFVELKNLNSLASATATFDSCRGLIQCKMPALPALTTAGSMFSTCFSLQSALFTSLPSLQDASFMFYSTMTLQGLILPAIPSTTNTGSIFGTDTETTCSRSLRRLVCPSLAYGIKLRYAAMQAAELNALFTSLGAASGAQTIDVRNNPGSATCDTSIATAKGYTVLTA